MRVPPGSADVAQVTLRFIFISDADKPVVALRVPEDMLFQEAFVTAVASWSPATPRSRA